MPTKFEDFSLAYRAFVASWKRCAIAAAGTRQKKTLSDFCSTSCECPILPTADHMLHSYIFSSESLERNTIFEPLYRRESVVCFWSTYSYHEFTFRMKICDYFQTDKADYSLNARVGANCKQVCASLVSTDDKSYGRNVRVFNLSSINSSKCQVTHRNQSFHAALYLFLRPFHSLQVHGFKSLLTLTHTHTRSHLTRSLHVKRSVIHLHWRSFLLPPRTRCKMQKSEKKKRQMENKWICKRTFNVTTKCIHTLGMP